LSGTLIGNLSSALTSNVFIRRVAVLAGGTALGQLLVALSSPFVTRLYGPAELGLLAVLVSILSPLLSMASLRYEVATVLPKKDDTALSIVYLSLAIVLLMGSLSLVVVWLFGSRIASLLNAPDLRNYLWFLPANILGGGVFQILLYLGIRENAYRTITQARLTQSVFSVVTQLGLGVASITPLGLFIGDTLGRTAGSGRLARNFAQTARRHPAPSIQSIRQVAGRYKKFPLFSVGPAVLNSLSLQLPTILLAQQFGPVPVGLFALGQRILGVPLNLVSSAVGQVFLGDMATTVRTEPHKMRPRILKTARILALIGTAVVLPVAIPAPWLFDFVFGARWGEAGQYVQLLAPMLILQFVSSPMGSILDVLERQDLHLIREVVRILLMFMAVGISLRISNDALVMVGCLSIAATLGYAAGLALVWKSIRDHEDRTPAGVAEQAQ
jgi:O-antigen/teichoic acid export membrane protein